MVRKIGNFILILFIFLFNKTFTTSDVKVELKAKDYNLTDLLNAGVGQPFILELTLEGEVDDNINPVIDNLDKYIQSHKGVSKAITNINGKQKINKIYLYEVRVDKIGKIKFGPVSFNNKKIEAILDISIEKEQKTKLIEDDDSHVIFTLAVNKSKVYLNESIEVTSKFFYKNNNINIIDYNFIVTKDFVIDKQKKIFNNQDTINDENYFVHETKMLIYPQKTGSLIIPSSKLIYEIPIIRPGFFGLFGHQFENREIVSNSVNIQVMDLPYFKEKIHGVGNFKNFTAKLNQTTASPGEAVVLRFEIDGKANLENLKIECCILDEKIKYYESKNYIEKIDSEFNKKIVEYIIQCYEVGNFTIPAQTFNFFDLETKKINSLKSEKINFQIKEIKHENANANDEIDDIKPINTQLNNKKTQWYISNDIFLVLMFLPVFFNFLFIRKFFFKDKNNSIINNAFKKLKQAKKKNNVTQIYNIFILYFVEKFEIISEPIVTNEVIKDKLSQSGISEAVIQQWELFFNKLNEITFFKNQCDEQDIFAQAFEWLNLFKKIL